MSVVSSGRRSHVPSIKSTDNTPRRFSSNSSSKRKILRFQLPHTDRVKTILQEYASGTNLKDYEQLVCSIRDDELRDIEIHSLLEEASQCLSILNQDLRLFVEALLTLKWVHRADSLIKEYQSFLVNLLSAHNYHVKFALDQLVLNFVPDASEKEWLNGVPTDEDCNKFANVHSVINILLKIIPMSRELLKSSFVNAFPYFKRPTHVHEAYLHNMLWVLDYQPELRLDFFYLIFSRLIMLDANAPKEKISQDNNSEEDLLFAMDDCKSVKSFKTVSSNCDGMKHEIAHTLDVCLDRIFNFMVIECHDLETGTLNWEKTKSLYHTFIEVFDKVILPTYNIHHVQFVMFFFCSFKSTVTEAYVNYLCKKVYSPSVPSIIRQTAVAYIASLLARGGFVQMNILKNTIECMAAWIHSYITTQDGLECLNSDVRVHAVFYSVCQALFYVISFRHKDLVNTRKNIAFLESLNLAKMVTCRLNPLRVCQSAVVQNFAAMTRTYQLAYCYSIIEHNLRNVMPVIYLDEKGCISTNSGILDSFFPFDPYLLKRSSQKIEPIYLEYKETSNETDKSVENVEMEVDDFLNDPAEKNTERFSYGTSPGFKFKH